MGTDQLLGPLELRLGYRLTGYFVDNDREIADDQNVFNLAVKVERWHSRIRRSEFSFTMAHDINDGGTSIGFGLQSFYNHARGYRDFDTDAVLFRSLKQERAAKHYYYN